jgi:hypothetical protein
LVKTETRRIASMMVVNYALIQRMKLRFSIDVIPDDNADVPPGICVRDLTTREILGAGFASEDAAEGFMAGLLFAERSGAETMIPR